MALEEAWRVLDDDGLLVIHTAPNRWYYQFGYPFYRLFQRLRGRKLPANPRDRFPCHHLHVNEQDPVRLRRALRKAGFESRVWLEKVSPPVLEEQSPLFQLVQRILVDVYPFRWVFRNDIFAIGRKRG